VTVNKLGKNKLHSEVKAKRSVSQQSKGTGEKIK